MRSKNLIRHLTRMLAAFAFIVTTPFIITSVYGFDQNPPGKCVAGDCSGSSGSPPSRGNGGIFRCLFGGCNDDNDNVPSGPTPEEIAARQRREAANRLVDQAQAAINRNDYQEALRLDEQALQLDPGNRIIAANVFFVRTRIAEKAENWDSAIQNMKKAVQNNPNADYKARLENLYGLVAYNQGHYAAAEVFFREASKLDPKAEVYRESLKNAQTKQAEQRREAEERHRKAEADRAEKAEQLRRQIQEARANDQQVLQERSRLEKEFTEKERGQMDARLRGALGQAQAALEKGGIEFDARRGRIEVAAGSAYMTKNPDKVDGKTGWLKDAVSTLSTTSEGQQVLKAQAEQQDIIRQSNEKIAGITAQLKTPTDDATKKKLNSDWSAEMQKQAEARLEIDKNIQKAKKIIDEVVLEQSANTGSSKDQLQKTGPPPPPPISQPGQ